MTINNVTINPKLDTHFRCLFIVALFPILLSFFILWTPAYDLSAVKIPLSLLVGPNLNATAEASSREDLFINSTMVEVPVDPYIQPIKPINLDPPSDAYNALSFASVHVSEDPLANLPEVRQKVEVDFTASSFKKKKREDAFTPIIIKAANRYEVNPAIIKAIIMAESSYNPNAVSYRGARGLMQLMPRTARALGVKDIFNPEQNITAGVRYFKQLLEQFNDDTALALAAYNAGSRKVRKYKGIPPFKATKKYIKNVLKYQKIYEEEFNG